MRALHFSSRRGASTTEVIVIVFLMVAVGVAVVTVFGHRIARRFSGASESLDEGRGQGMSARGVPANLDQVGNPGNAPVLTGPLPTVNPVTSDPLGTGNPNPGPGGVPARTPDDNAAVGGATLARPTGWDPASMLAGMTQIDGNGGTQWDGVRCGLATALATRILAGPEAVDRLLADLARRARDGSIPNSSAGPPPMVGRFTVDQYIARLGTLRDRLENMSLDHGDLGMIQELMFEGYGKIGPPPNWTYWQDGPGTPGYQRVLELGGGVDPGGGRIGAPNGGNNQFTQSNRATVVQHTNALGPGESITLGVAEFGGSADHFIAVGRDPSGRVYLYDPWPHTTGGAPGTPAPQLVYYDQNPQMFDYYLDNYQPPGGFMEYSPVRH